MKKLSNNKEIIFNLYIEVQNSANIDYIIGTRAKTYIAKRSQSDVIKLSMLDANYVADIKDSKRYNIPEHCTEVLIPAGDQEWEGVIESIEDIKDLLKHIATIRAIPLVMYNSNPQKYMALLFNDMFLEIEKEYCTKINHPLAICTAIKKDKSGNWVARVDNVIHL